MIQSILYSLVIFFLNIKSMTNVSERNQLKYEAEKAIEQKNYHKAAAIYQRLTEATFVVNPELRLDLAHANYMIGDTAKARLEYQKIRKVADRNVASTAFLQLGLIYLLKKDSSEALNNFKLALEKDQENETARFNFEWLRKMMPIKNQNKQLAKMQPLMQQEQINKEKPIPPKKDLDEEESLQVLNAMKASDIEYLSKQRHRATNKTSNDW